MNTKYFRNLNTEQKIFYLNTLRGSTYATILGDVKLRKLIKSWEIVGWNDSRKDLYMKVKLPHQTKSQYQR
jgi:hypothetical protein